MTGCAGAPRAVDATANPISAFPVKSLSCLAVSILIPAIVLSVSPAARAEEQNFSAWLEGLRQEAAAAGISTNTLDAALTGLEPLPRIIEYDRNQPEFKQTLEEYMAGRVSAKRVERGRRMLEQHGPLLREIGRRYGVQPRFLVALWGIESNYGDHTGKIPVIQALATLAFDPRRAAYFRGELLHALHIADSKSISLAQMRGSWAGAMGQLQFMPSTFRSHAVDYDGDGRIDLWNSVPDVLASAANYLARNGWRDDTTWGRRVRLPPDFDYEQTGHGIRKSLQKWNDLGVRRLNGQALPARGDLRPSLILPDGQSGPAFLVYENFRVLLIWNRSDAFAVAVGTLGERLVDREGSG